VQIRHATSASVSATDSSRPSASSWLAVAALVSRVLKPPPLRGTGRDRQRSRLDEPAVDLLALGDRGDLVDRVVGRAPPRRAIGIIPESICGTGCREVRRSPTRRCVPRAEAAISRSITRAQIRHERRQ